MFFPKLQGTSTRLHGITPVVVRLLGAQISPRTPFILHEVLFVFSPAPPGKQQDSIWIRP
jgi:hypothetical protein